MSNHDINDNNDDEFMDFNYFIKEHIGDNNNIGNLDDVTYTENPKKLYQIQYDKKKGAIIKYLGINNKVPLVVCHEFNFDKYRCNIVSHILCDDDLKNDNNKKYSILELLIFDETILVAKIGIYFNVKTMNETPLILENEIDYQLDGEFTYEITCYKIGESTKTNVVCRTNYIPGKKTIVSELIKYLSSEHLEYLFS